MGIIRKAGIISCSNGLQSESRHALQQMAASLSARGITPVMSDCLYAVSGVGSGSAQQRAACLMSLYRDPEIDAIFDVSGGDIANEILPYLDYDEIARARTRTGEPKQFWGYSDLTTVLNAIYSMSGCSGVLYQMRFFSSSRADSLFDFDYTFLQGDRMSGTVAGGNIRCLLKLAGTPYFPDLSGKILFLEARSGLQPQLIAYLSQLQQMRAFEKVGGILLGTFTQLDQAETPRAAGQLVRQFASVPIAKTHQIGHAPDSKAICIGKPLTLRSDGRSVVTKLHL